MTESDYIVRFENVQKSYDGETLVVKNFNIDIERGEFLTMLGPSGSGKTTCLMMLAGFEPATLGRFQMMGGWSRSRSFRPRRSRSTSPNSWCGG